ncbi:MAG: Potassium transporter TrkA [Anaerolineales bacterium]|jgi:trk system potassium uptake protein TrkA|nr:Potassium transporter TrkA [Anaerolineales bacterium]MBM2849601.1 Potassium transporter TrkA [Anaerolineales bacterium]
MFVIIVGGGRTGSHLAELLVQEGHAVKVIDDRPEILERLRQEMPAEAVVAGDGSDPNVLEAVGVKRAQVLAAVTAEDEANLVATSLARFEFNVPRVIARVNDPKNAWMFTAEMGVDVALNNADILAKLIAEEMSLGDMMIMLKIRRGKYSLVEEKIYPGAHAVGQTIKDLPLPPNCIISGILRYGEMVLPRGITVLEEGDEILALVDEPARLELARLLGRPAGA